VIALDLGSFALVVSNNRNEFALVAPALAVSCGATALAGVVICALLFCIIICSFAVGIFTLLKELVEGMGSIMVCAFGAGCIKILAEMLGLCSGYADCIGYFIGGAFALGVVGLLVAACLKLIVMFVLGVVGLLVAVCRCCLNR
jgi:hypothetical protein